MFRKLKFRYFLKEKEAFIYSDLTNYYEVVCIFFIYNYQCAIHFYVYIVHEMLFMHAKSWKLK